MKTVIVILILAIILCASSTVHAATYWVHPTDNTATWNAEGCQAESDPCEGSGGAEEFDRGAG